MLERIFRLLALTCSHKRITQPFVAASGTHSPHREWESVGAGPDHYVVCLDCGRKFAYDWATMRIVR